jgi:hypothetical protein
VVLFAYHESSLGENLLPVPDGRRRHHVCRVFLEDVAL